jgi:hypothetical protein
MFDGRENFGFAWMIAKTGITYAEIAEKLLELKNTKHVVEFMQYIYKILT